MARGPFQGTFQPNARPTVATAPDALVYINGEAEAIGCPQCSRTFNFNKYITSIQTDLSVDSSPGSANVSLSVPRHAIDDFYFDGNPVITTMMEIEIFAKGHYLVEGMPQYYPIFWGIVTEVSDNYSGGEHTVSIHAGDILKWWELCKININPAFTAPSGQLGVSYFGNVFANANPYDIIFTLATASFGDVLVGTGSTKNLVREATQPGTYSAALSDMMLYWEKRFAKMRSNLVLYGTSGAAVRGDTLSQEYSKNPTPTANRHLASTAVRQANGGADGGQMTFDPADEKVVAFKTVAANAGPGGFLQSEYQTKLEIAVAAKEAIGFEFFMDVTGDIVFKPPFYNLDVLANKPTSWVQDIDVIDWDFSESESEVVTQIVMQGAFSSTLDVGTPADVHPFTTVTDYHLLRKYGWRSQNYNAEFATDPIALFSHGLDVLDRINSRRHRANVTIPMRAELRLGFPIYLAPKDQIWYVSGISHSIQFGGRATTTLQLTGKRGKFIAPRGIGDLKLMTFNGAAVVASKDGAPKSFPYTSRQLQQSGVFKLDVGNAVELPANPAAFNAKGGEDNPAAPLILRHPKTGRIVGYPNVVMAYTRPFADSDVLSVSALSGERAAAQASPQTAKQVQSKVSANRAAQEQQKQSRASASGNSVMIGKHLHSTYQYGLNSAGVFVYAHDSTPNGGVIREALMLDTSRVEVTPPPENKNASLANPHSLIRPVSDERGFEVIGHYQYGRRISLRDGRLITNSPGGAAKIDLQLALSGGLSGMLMAQSQGLTTVVSGYADPAATLATMTADERETAAAFPGSENNPNTKAPEFTNVGDNFVGAPTLGSPQIEPSVEATQLSRALSLAEMAIRDSQTVADEDCVCITGRADLAFMSSDYQVKVLRGGPVAQDFSSLENIGLVARGGPIQVSSTQAGTEKVAALEARIEVALSSVRDLERQIDKADPARVDALTSMYLDAQQSLDSLVSELTTAQLDLDEQRSQYGGSNSLLTSTPSELTSRVERFLVNLYSTLDDAHQEFEKSIRGDLFPKSNADFSNLNAADTNPPSEFAPPFSAPGRFQLGDPNAAIGSAQSNAEGLSKAWSTFSENLQSDSQKRALSTQLSQDRASIARLTATRDQLINQRDSSTVVLGVDIQKQIDSLGAEISKLQTQAIDNQAKLNEVK